MRRIGSWILIILSWGVLAVLYWLTPYLMHSPTRWVNFLELLAVGAAVTSGVVMLSAGVAMRRKGLVAPPARRVPVPPVGVQAIDLEHELALIQSHINVAREVSDKTLAELPLNERIDHLAVAMDSLMVMLKRRAGLK